MSLKRTVLRWLALALVVTSGAGVLVPRGVFSAPAKPVVEAPPPKVFKVGGWIGTGDGKSIDSPVGFVGEGIRPLAVTHASAGAWYIISGDVAFAPGASVRVTFGPDPLPVAKPVAGAATQPASTPAAAAPEPILLATGALVFDKDGKTFKYGRGAWTLPEPVSLTFPLAIFVGSNVVNVCLDRVSETRTRLPGQTVNVSVILAGGEKVENLKLTPLPVGTLVPVLEASRKANAVVAGEGATVGKLDPSSIQPGVNLFDGVPFYLPNGVKSGLDVAASMSGVKEPFRNKGNFFVDGALGTNGRLVLPISPGQYSTLHLIAFSAGRSEHVPRVTVRAGIYASRAILEDAVVEVPSLGAVAAGNGGIQVKLADGTAGFVHHIRVPMAQTGNIKDLNRFDLEFTRDMNTHVIPPDPNEFGTVPAGLPSDVVVLAATLEPSPVTMSYLTDEGGNVFYDTQKVVFKMTLTNRSDKPAKVRAFANAAGPGTGEELGVEMKKIAAQQNENLRPGETKEVALDVTPGKRGWFSCTLGVECDGKLVQSRDTTFAVLAPDTRKATTDSPFGVWEFWSAHSSVRGTKHNDILGSLMLKGGWRWTYGGSPVKGEDGVDEPKRISDKYKIKWTLQGLKESYQRGAGWFNEEEFKASVPAAVNAAVANGEPTYYKVMHESRSSSDLIRRLNEFLGGAPYNMPAAEKERIDKQFENVKKYCLAIKAISDKAKIVLINDYPEVAMQFLQRGMPKESFDVIGLEGAMFMRAPERQPDWMSLLGNLHQMRLAQEKYGYNKPVWTTEALYHGTEAGYLSLHDQGVISVREAMMALQLGVERMAAAGLIKDPTDDYHWSNWGSCGFCYREPEINPKPSYAMYAWMTQVLDQAKPVGKLAVPNDSLHVVDFKKTDGSHVYSLWTANGAQAVTFKAAGTPVVFDVFGNIIEARGLKLVASPTPQYITGATLEAVLDAAPVEDKTPIGTVVNEFDKAGDFKILTTPNKVVESNWDTPRMKGDFESAFVQEEGKSVLKVTLKPDGDARKLLPRYVEYQLERPVVLQGRPHAFTVRLKGNSGWGQIMFEMRDAKGRVWTSCGNQYAGASNSSDPRGYSHVSFEGWKTMWIPIVGMYPLKDQMLYWPDNYTWWPTNTPEDAEREALIGESKVKLEAELKQYEQAVDKWDDEHAKWEEAKDAAVKDGKKPPVEPVKPSEPKANIPRNLGQCPVDYPLTLTKVIVTMRPSILYLDEERPVKNPTLLIDSLGVLEAPAGK